MSPAREPRKPSPGTALSAGVVVVRKSGDGWRVLLLRAYNYWDFPKGLVEPGEDPLTTARREVREESGIDDLAFDWGEVHFDTEPYGRDLKTARYFIARSHAEKIVLGVNPELGKPEHQEGRWLRFEDARSYAVPRIALVLAWARAVVHSDEPAKRAS